MVCNMNIIFYNECKYVVLVSVNLEKPAAIQPYGTMSIECQSSENIDILVKRDIISYARKRKYTFVIETRYRFANVNNNERFRIVRENIRAEYKIYLERLFLIADKAELISQSHNVLGKEEIERRYRRYRIRDLLLTDAFWNAPFLIIGLLLLGIVLTFVFGWKLALLYFPILYAAAVILAWLNSKLDVFIYKKVFKDEDETERNVLDRYLKSESIAKYYLDPERTPYNGEIEIN